MGASYDAFCSHCDRKHYKWKESFDGIRYADRHGDTDSSSNVGELSEASDIVPLGIPVVV